MNKKKIKKNKKNEKNAEVKKTFTYSDLIYAP